MQNSAGTILQFELYPPLFTYNVEFYSSSSVNIDEWLVSRPEVPNLEYMYPYGYICQSKGVHLRLAIEEKYIFTYLIFPKIYA